MGFLDMKTIRYINLLDKFSHIKTRYCFEYNNMIVFAVPKSLVSRAIGPDASNARRMQETIGKRIKIVFEPESAGDIEKFIQIVVEPVQFKEVIVNDGEVIITAGTTTNKAALLGRNKKRLEELQLIVKDVFGKQLRVI